MIMNKNIKDKPEKRETYFVAILLKYKIGNKFRPPPNCQWGPFFNWGAPKMVGFSEKSAVYPHMSALATLLN